MTKSVIHNNCTGEIGRSTGHDLLHTTLATPAVGGPKIARRNKLLLSWQVLMDFPTNRSLSRSA